MDRNVYLLATDPRNPCRDVIHSRDTGLKVNVFCVDEEKFKADPDEIQLYAYADGRLYAFETINVTPDDALDVIDAIQWYAGYVNCPDMEILPEDPRMGQNMAM